MAKRRPSRKQDPRERFRDLIEEATVDCYDEEEQHSGFQAVIEDEVVCPFRARVIGEEVEVTGLESTPSGLGLNAVCRYRGKTYRVDIASLGWAPPYPKGFRWIQAYFAWRGDLVPEGGEEEE
jgi:Calcium binding